VDLNMMMREQAKMSLQTQLDTAVTAGDTEAARKVAAEIAKLEVSSAPKPPPYGDAEIRAELNKLEWFGVDPKKSAKALEFGKTMDPKKFATADLFAAAIVKAVDEEFKPVAAAATTNEDDDPDGEDGEKKPAATAKRTDGPGPGDTDPRPRSSGRTGPWSKLSDAPQEVRTEIKRAADKFLPANADDKTRDAFNKRQLEAHYATHQRKKGK